ncbi:HIT family protein [archaeon]|nr:HIT family protein [archaeon]|tara:strand:- start:5573 stop:5977 length:405 start_codon:yes stop_codon:yes gene_type:complete
MENEVCIFCKITKGEIPCYKVFEDNNFLAFLDITPKNKGHTLLIPKKHYRWVWEVEEDYSKVSNKIANALKKTFATDWVVSFVMGQDVPHAHIHFVPRFDETDGHGPLIDISKTVNLSKEEMEDIAKKIQDSLE